MVSVYLNHIINPLGMYIGHGPVTSFQILLSIGFIITRDEAVFFFVTGERVQFRILPLLAAAKPDFIPAHLCWLKNGSLVGGE